MEYMQAHMPFVECAFGYDDNMIFYLSLQKFMRDSVSAARYSKTIYNLKSQWITVLFIRNSSLRPARLTHTR